MDGADGLVELLSGGTEGEAVAALRWRGMSTHVQAERRCRHFSLLPNGKCSGIFNLDLGVRLHWKVLQFHISSQPLMSTSCEIGTKNVLQGYPWTKPRRSVPTRDLRVQ